MLRPATPLTLLFLVAFVLLLLSTLSTPIINKIPLGSYDGYNFGVFGFCEVTDGNGCTTAKVGYGTDNLWGTGDSGQFTLPEDTRHTLSSILVVHPVAAFMTLVCTILAGASHFRGPAHSPRYLLALLILTFPTLLITLLAFLVDILLFIPHMSWGGWIVLAATIITLACSVLTCAMRRTLVSRKARKKRIDENENMNGEEFYAMRQDNQYARAESPPPVDMATTNGVAQKPNFATFEYASTRMDTDDTTPLVPVEPSSGSRDASRVRNAVGTTGQDNLSGSTVVPIATGAVGTVAGAALLNDSRQRMGDGLRMRDNESVIPVSTGTSASRAEYDGTDPPMRRDMNGMPINMRGRGGPNDMAMGRGRGGTPHFSGRGRGGYPPINGRGGYPPMSGRGRGGMPMYARGRGGPTGAPRGVYPPRGPFRGAPGMSRQGMRGPPPPGWNNDPRIMRGGAGAGAGASMVRGRGPPPGYQNGYQRGPSGPPMNQGLMNQGPMSQGADSSAVYGVASSPYEQRPADGYDGAVSPADPNLGVLYGSNPQSRTDRVVSPMDSSPSALPYRGGPVPVEPAAIGRRPAPDLPAEFQRSQSPRRDPSSFGISGRQPSPARGEPRSSSPPPPIPHRGAAAGQAVELDAATGTVPEMPQESGTLGVSRAALGANAPEGIHSGGLYLPRQIWQTEPLEIGSSSPLLAVEPVLMSNHEPIELPTPTPILAPALPATTVPARASTDNYYEDVDPRFASEPTSPAAPPSRPQQMPSSLMPGYMAQRTLGSLSGGGEHSSVYSDTANRIADNQSPAHSEASDFTSISQRGINPNWRPPPGQVMHQGAYHPSGVGGGGGGGGGGSRWGTGSYTTVTGGRAMGPRQDTILAANPDFQLPGGGGGGARGMGASGTLGHGRYPEGM